MEYLPESGSSSKYEITEDDKKRIDVPFFSLKSILIATDKFSDANRLGQGGFGPVYKVGSYLFVCTILESRVLSLYNYCMLSNIVQGIFPQGQEMAVKRLSSHSSQGAEEFKNEVMLIAKLQHRNLVRLLGYCIEANEKILLYEYMPNKSLDTFIFGESTLLLVFCNLPSEKLLHYRFYMPIVVDLIIVLKLCYTNLARSYSSPVIGLEDPIRYYLGYCSGDSLSTP